MAKTCPKCGVSLPDDSEFCLKCGTHLTSNDSVYFCRFCGKQLPLSSAYNCPHCGKILSEANNSVIPKLVAIVSILIAVVASFTPFLTYSYLGNTVSVSLWNKNFISLTIVDFILLFFELSAVLKNKYTVGRDSIVLGLVFLGDICLQFTSNNSRFANHDTKFEFQDLSNLLNPGIGFYLLIIAGIGFVVAGILYKQNKK